MRRKLKLILATILIVAISVLQLNQVAAYQGDVQEEQTNTLSWEDKGDFPYITKVELTDGDGNIISDENHVDPNNKIRIKYEFKIPNDVEIYAGDMYTISIPEGFELDGGLPETQLDKDGKYNVTWQLEKDIITIKFYEDLDKVSNIQGYIALDCWIDTDVIADGDGEKVDFIVNGEKFQCDIYYDKYQKATNATVKKTGAYNASAKEITWTITVTPDKKDATLANITVKDIFTNSDYQEYVAGSTKISDVDISDAELKFTEKGFSYKFPEDITAGEKTITYKTKPTDVFYESLDDYIKNGVEIYMPNEDKASEAEASVKVRQTSISKVTVGKYDEESKVLKWKITLNKDNRLMKNVEVTDTYPEGTHIDISSIKINDVLLKDTEVTYEQKDNQIIFKLGDVSKESFITYDLVIDDFSKLPKNVNGEYAEYDVKNTVVLNVNDKQEYTYTATGKIGTGKKEISFTKSGSISSSTENGLMIKWQIKVNYTSQEKQSAFVISDIIPEGQEYVKGTAKIKLYRNNAETSGILIDDKDIYDEENRKLSYEIIPNKTVIGKYTVNEDDGVMLYFYTAIKDIKFGTGLASKYSNNAKLTIGEKEKDCTGQVTAYFYNMLSKSGSYDYANELYNWQINVNAQKTALKQPVIEEILPENHIMAEDYITINNTKVTLDGKENGIYQAVYNKQIGTILISVNSDKYIQDVLYIKLKTKSIEDEKTGSKAKNTAKLNAENFDREFSVESTVEHKALPILQKKTDYSSGNVIPWTVNINLDYEDKGQELKLEDKLQAGLSLDKDSVKLYEGSISSDGKNIVAGNEIEIPAENIHYDDTTGVFECILPKEVEAHKYYVLKFSTEIVDRNIEQVSNTITLYGMEAAEEGKSTTIKIKTVSSSSGIVGESGSVKIVKKDRETDEVIPNVSFRLLNKDEKPIESAGWVTTGEDGIAEFKDWLKFDTQYYIQEVRTAQGYVYDDSMYPIMIKSSDDTKIFEIEVYNDKIVVTPTPTAIVVTPTPTAIVVTPPPTLPPIIWIGTPEPTIFRETPRPTVQPTVFKETYTPKPTVQPTVKPTVFKETSTPKPTVQPTVFEETPKPTIEPTVFKEETPKPTVQPTGFEETSKPTVEPTIFESTIEPTVLPTPVTSAAIETPVPTIVVIDDEEQNPGEPVIRRQTPKPTEKVAKDENNVAPSTMDNSKSGKWLITFIISGIMIILMMINIRKKDDKKE